METNRSFFKAEWPLIEEIARKVYENELSILTKSDIKEIEESIDLGHVFSAEEQEGGEMNFDTNSIIQVVTLGFAALQVVVGYVSWRYPGKFLQNSNIKSGEAKKDYFPKSNIKIDVVGDLISELSLPQKVQSELQKHKNVINEIINERLCENTQNTLNKSQRSTSKNE